MRATLAGAVVALLVACGPGQEHAATGERQAPADGAIAVLVGRLDLERYKAVIRGLTQFGDRRQGTRRNREAVDWIEAQLEAAGCPTERHHYTYDPPPRPRVDGAGRRGAGDAALNPTEPTPTGRTHRTQRQRSGRQLHLRLPAAHRRRPRSPGPAGRGAARAEPRGTDQWRALAGLLHQGRRHAPRRNVHPRRAHGRSRVRRGRRRRRIGHGAGDGAGAHPQRAGRRDRRLDPLRTLEQRGDRAQRQPRLRRRPARAAGPRRPARFPGATPSPAGWG